MRAMRTSHRPHLLLAILGLNAAQLVESCGVSSLLAPATLFAHFAGCEASKELASQPTSSPVLPN